jgi:isocitrate dehydrogenase (NAD+)
MAAFSEDLKSSRPADDGPPLRIVVCQGDETGQELLDVVLPVLEESVCGLRTELEVFDLSLSHRRATANAVVSDAAEAMRAAGLGLKAATVTPIDRDDVGSPNRILREAIDGTVIMRTGRRIPGVAPYAPVTHPICVVRMAVGDAYGAAEIRRGLADSGDEVAERTERITRSVCSAVAEYAFRTAAELGGCVFGGPKWTVSPVYEGLLKEEMDAAAARHLNVGYQPMLIDATYAELITGSRDVPLVIPALNRDGDCLSDLVLGMFGSIAGSESVVIALDGDLNPTVAMAEAPHGTAPSLHGRNVANPMAMFLAVAAVLDHAARRGHQLAGPAGSAVRLAVLDAAAAGTRTVDLGGTATTTEVADEVIERVKARRPH